MCPIFVLLYISGIFVYHGYQYFQQAQPLKHIISKFFITTFWLLILFFIWQVITRNYGPSYINFSVKQLTEDFWIPFFNILKSTEGIVLYLFALGFTVLLFFMSLIKGTDENIYKLSRFLFLSCLGLFLVWYALISAMEWTKLNLYMPRYYYPALILLTLPSLLIFTYLFSKLHINTLFSWFFLLPLVFIISEANLLDFKNPLEAKIFRDVNGLSSVSGSRLYAGDYWTSWPLVVRDLSNGFDSYGICFRGKENIDNVLTMAANKLEGDKYLEVVCTNAKLVECMRQVFDFLGKDVSISNVIQGNNSYTLKLARNKHLNNENETVISPFNLSVVTKNAEYISNPLAIIQTKNGEGLISYGPYISLKSGVYELFVNYQSSKEKQPTFDIWINEKQEKLAQGFLSSQPIRIRIKRTNEGKPVEFRTYCTKGCDLKIYSMKLKKIN